MEVPFLKKLKHKVILRILHHVVEKGADADMMQFTIKVVFSKTTEVMDHFLNFLLLSQFCVYQ